MSSLQTITCKQEVKLTVVHLIWEKLLVDIRSDDAGGKCSPRIPRCDLANEVVDDRTVYGNGFSFLDEPGDGLCYIHFVIHRIFSYRLPKMLGVFLVVEDFTDRSVGSTATAPTEHALVSVNLTDPVGHHAFANGKLWVRSYPDLHHASVRVR